MNNTEINSGVFPTMITPYKKDGSIDYDAARRLTVLLSKTVVTGFCGMPVKRNGFFVA